MAEALTQDNSTSISRLSVDHSCSLLSGSFLVVDSQRFLLVQADAIHSALIRLFV